MISYALSILSPSARDIHLSSTRLNVSSKLHSASIHDLSVNSVKAGNNVFLLNSSIKNHVEAILGHVDAKNSTISGNIRAGSWVKIENSSVQDVISSMGFVSSLNSNIKNIEAYQNIDLLRSTVQDRVYSAFGSISSLHSKLCKVIANGDIKLTDSSATSLKSISGRVTIKHTEPVRGKTIALISALKDVELENCNLEEVYCREKAIIKNCSLNKLFLCIENSDEEAVLDLQGTLVKDTIKVECNPSILKNALASFFNLLWEGSTLPLSEFSLFIKGEEIPLNLEFVGFKEEELSFIKAERESVEGTLVTGKKFFFKDSINLLPSLFTI
jgi:hypothetical protein